MYLHIYQIFLLPKKSPNEKYQNKKEIPFIVSVTLTLPSSTNPRLGPGPGSNIVFAVLFGCWQYFGTSPPPSPPSSVCPGFSQLRNILMSCAILLQYVALKASIKHK